jgi:8-oxo-dGTP pyrophosphatase MutT (NUDIX family)
MTAVSSLSRLPQRLIVFFARLAHGMTLGVRAAVIDGDGRVLLVRHTYAPGWHFPGGGVQPGETVEAALRRELMEEAGIALGERPEFFGLYLNRAISRRDHVALFVCRKWQRVLEPRLPTVEIAAAGFFPLDALPDGVSGGTRRRLAEILDGAERSAEW